MFSRRLIVKTYLWFLVALTLTVVGVAGTFWFFSGEGREGHPQDWLVGRLRPVKTLVEGVLAAGVPPRKIAHMLQPMLDEFEASVAILSADGAPLAQGRAAGLDGLQDTPLPTPTEIGAILRDGMWVNQEWWGRPHRFQAALAIDMGDGSRGVIFWTVYPHFGREGPFPTRLLWGLAVLLGLAWLLCWPLAAYLTRPLKRMAAAADALGEGRLDTRIVVHRRDEIGRLADRFNAMAANLQGLVEGHKQLLADISHELRSPLARQRVALELARQDDPGAAKAYLDQMERQIEALDSLIGELLAHSRLDAMPYGLKLAAVAPEALAREEVAALEGEAAARKVAFRLEGGAAGRAIQADARLVRRALANGLGNAIAHAPAGSTVRVGVGRENGRLVFTIADQGPGVAPELLDKIFQPFFRVDSARSRATGGVGLGLAITRRAMEAHGGGAKAGPGPDGKGFLLTLWLPWKEGEKA